MSTPASKTFKCHCGDWRFNNAHFIVDDVRKEVCRNLPLFGVVDDKPYCILHFPGKTKGLEFQKVLDERMKEDKWDFRMVFFPNAINYEPETEFTKNADFAHAVFADRVRFDSCKFLAKFEFFDAKFLDDALFFGSHFVQSINFNASTFEGYSNFRGATFKKESRITFEGAKFHSGFFDSATFECDGHFRRTQFAVAAEFANATFESKANFEGLVLQDGCKVDFRRTTFKLSVTFENVEFPTANFSTAIFGEVDARSFNHVNFKKTRFLSEASFLETCFYNKSDFSETFFAQQSHFERAVFADSVSFRNTVFSDDAFFNDVRFGYKDGRRVRSSEAKFDGAEFGENCRAFFDNTWFSWHTSFDYAKFRGHVFFKGSSDNLVFDDVFESHAFWGLVSFVNTTFEVPQKVYFQTVRLRPSWFVNSVFDVRLVNFADVYWEFATSDRATIQAELAILQKRVHHNTKKLLSICFRQLADNAEANNRFLDASTFRRMAFETERLVRKARQDKWWREEVLPKDFALLFFRKLRDAPFDFASFLYQKTSLYGESSARAFVVLCGVLVIFGILYCFPFSSFADGGQMRSLALLEGLFYSMRIMVLQRPDPAPFSNFAKGLVAIESVIAPLQLALLALALRRKFLR